MMADTQPSDAFSCGKSTGDEALGREVMALSTLLYLAGPCPLLLTKHNKGQARVRGWRAVILPRQAKDNDTQS